MSQKSVKKARKDAPKERDFTKEMDDRCLPTALAILKVIVDSGKLPTSLLATGEDKNKIYFEYMKEIQPILIKNGVGISEDLSTISKMLEETMYVLMESMKASLNENQMILRNAMFGLDDQTDEIITTKMLSDAVVVRDKIKTAVREIVKQAEAEKVAKDTEPEVGESEK
jgi:hypothetical protein